MLAKEHWQINKEALEQSLKYTRIVFQSNITDADWYLCIESLHIMNRLCDLIEHCQHAIESFESVGDS